MKWIKYKIKQASQGDESVFITKKIVYTDANLVIAQKEAYNNSYTIEEDEEAFDKEPLPIEFGGTGAKTVEDALLNLGLCKVLYENETGIASGNDIIFDARKHNVFVVTLAGGWNSEAEILCTKSLLGGYSGGLFGGYGDHITGSNVTENDMGTKQSHYVHIMVPNANSDYCYLHKAQVMGADAKVTKIVGII